MNDCDEWTRGLAARNVLPMIGGLQAAVRRTLVRASADAWSMLRNNLAVDVALAVLAFVWPLLFYRLGEGTTAGIATPATALIPLALAVLGIFAYQMIRAPGRIRQLQAQTSVDDLVARSGRDGMVAYLRSGLGASKLQVRRAYVFGSAAVKPLPTRDIDVVMQFHEATERAVRSAHSRLMRFALDFERSFGVGIHFQFYLASEDERLERFLVKAGTCLQIVGDAAST